MANEKRLIDANKAKKYFNLYFGGVSHAVIANMILDKQPTVDAVEVVRCKDCKHYMYEDYCGLLYGMDRRNPGDFCSYGERRTDHE